MTSTSTLTTVMPVTAPGALGLLIKMATTVAGWPGADIPIPTRPGRCHGPCDLRGTMALSCCHKKAFFWPGVHGPGPRSLDLRLARTGCFCDGESEGHWCGRTQMGGFGLPLRGLFLFIITFFCRLLQTGEK